MRPKSTHSLKLGIRLQPENQLTFPAILHYLESQNEDQRFDLEIIRNQKQLATFVGRNHPSLLLYSFMTTRIASIFREISWILDIRNPGVKLVSGGPHTQGDPVSSLKMGFDYAIMKRKTVGKIFNSR